MRPPGSAFLSFRWFQRHPVRCIASPPHDRRPFGGASLPTNLFDPPRAPVRFLHHVARIASSWTRTPSSSPSPRGILDFLWVWGLGGRRRPPSIPFPGDAHGCDLVVKEGRWAWKETLPLPSHGSGSLSPLGKPPVSKPGSHPVSTPTLPLWGIHPLPHRWRSQTFPFPPHPPKPRSGPGRGGDPRGIHPATPLSPPGTGKHPPG